MDSEKIVNIIKGRDDFINKYCEEKGLNKFDLSLDQILIIRNQDGWKNPKEVALQT